MKNTAYKNSNNFSMTNKIAFLIDGDNAECSIIHQMLAEAEKHGRVTIRRIYGDWGTPTMRCWRKIVEENAFKPIQKFSIGKGKNSTDTALIIDAMDILHENLVDGFCIASSDGDFSGLAQRIREKGKFVIGIGRQHTPKTLVTACDEFIYTEDLKKNQQENSEVINAENQSSNEKVKKEDVFAHGKVEIVNGNSQNGQLEESEKHVIPTIRTMVQKLLGPRIIGKINPDANQTIHAKVKYIDYSIVDKAFEMAKCKDTGLAPMARFASCLREVHSEFYHKDCGFSSFKKFCESLGPRYVLERDNETKQLFLKFNG